MAFPDVLSRVCNAQSLAGIPIGTISDNVWDVTSSGTRLRDIMRGNPVYCRMQVVEAFASAGDPLLVPYVIFSETAALASAVKPVLVPMVFTKDGLGAALGNLVGYVKADLTLGAEFVFPLPYLPLTVMDDTTEILGRRFIGIVFAITATTYTTGKLTIDFGHYAGGLRPPIYATGYSGP